MVVFEGVYGQECRWEGVCDHWHLESEHSAFPASERGHAERWKLIHNPLKPWNTFTSQVSLVLFIAHQAVAKFTGFTEIHTLFCHLLFPSHITYKPNSFQHFEHVEFLFQQLFLSWTKCVPSLTDRNIVWIHFHINLAWTRGWLIRVSLMDHYYQYVDNYINLEINLILQLLMYVCVCLYVCLILYN